jgi:hypothetical protein
MLYKLVRAKGVLKSNKLSGRPFSETATARPITIPKQFPSEIARFGFQFPNTDALGLPTDSQAERWFDTLFVIALKHQTSPRPRVAF